MIQRDFSATSLPVLGYWVSRLPLPATALWYLDRIVDWFGRSLGIKAAQPLTPHPTPLPTLTFQLRVPARGLALLHHMIEADLAETSPFSSQDGHTVYALSGSLGEVEVTAGFILEKAVKTVGAGPAVLENGLIFNAPTPPATALLKHPLVLVLVAYCLLVAAGFSTASTRLHDARTAVESRLSAVQSEGREAVTLRRETREKQDALSKPREWVKASPLPLDLLASVTEALPKGAWLTSFMLEDGVVSLRGKAGSASDLPARLAKTTGQREIRFASPVTVDSDDLEAFHIEIRIAPVDQMDGAGS